VTTQNVEKGDVLYIEVDSWILNPDGTRKLHDTTHEELAKQEKMHEEKKFYGEIPVVVGHERLPKGLEEDIIGKAVGVEGEVVVPPEKGAGQRDAKLVSLHSIREFVKLDVEPVIGMPIVIKGRRGYVSAITAGRVRVDYNNPLAGKTLQYKYKIAKRAESLEDKLRALIEMDYGLGDEFKFKVSEEGAEVVIPDLCKTDESWLVAKFRLVADVREMNLVKKIRFVEEYEKKEEKKEEEKKEAKPAEAPVEAPGEKPAEEPEQKPKEKPAGKPKEKAPPHKKKEKVAEEELLTEEKAPEEL